MTTFEEFLAEIEAEARAEGPEAVAEIEAFRRHFASRRRDAAADQAPSAGSNMNGSPSSACTA